jgi:hypothetical protein
VPGVAAHSHGEEPGLIKISTDQQDAMVHARERSAAGRGTR